MLKSKCVENVYIYILCVRVCARAVISRPTHHILQTLKNILSTKPHKNHTVIILMLFNENNIPSIKIILQLQYQSYSRSYIFFFFQSFSLALG